MKVKQIIEMKVLPGEPTDGSGRVCVHLVIQDEHGPFTVPCMMHIDTVENEHGRPTKTLIHRPTRARLACDPRRTVAPVTRNGVTTVTMRTDDPRATTCPKCISSVGYAEAMGLLTSVVGR